jgi:hypothetical protein
MESLAAAEVKPHNGSMMRWNGRGLESSAQVGGRRVTTPPNGRAPAGSSNTQDLSQQGRRERLLKTGWVDTLRTTQTAGHAAVDGRCTLWDGVHADLQHSGFRTCGCPVSLACVSSAAVSGRHLLQHIAITPCCG